MSTEASNLTKNEDPTDIEEDGTLVTITIKWSSKEYPIDSLKDYDTVLQLKTRIYEETGVKPERQKLIGLKTKSSGPMDDTTKISELFLKPGVKIMMVGSKEEDIDSIDLDPLDIPYVINDFDIEDDELDLLAIHNRSEYQAKIEKRVKEIRINILNEMRSGKKLLVLDIDYTLFDHRSIAEHASHLMRPYLHEFLESAYQDYDIVIWSATSMKWIEIKMRQLGCTRNSNYKIAFFLDITAMISIHTQKYGVINVKPLGVIWGKFPQFNHKNTIMFDDLRRNFLMNPQNGLKIKSYRNAYKNKDKDKELYHLAKYLKLIALLNDFSSLNHDHWHKMI
ncbi:Ubiquitin-like domain-containing CTD phosphatase 1 [Sarcoptes scabiei]|uniref:Ubiquitin-like domain-containing CTD phosphatase 1 n=1 Tax=Sarcoptes scabiei TaxID=52283 RepID=A0A131ZX37_SARSC|nr:Ubiquitin-like domain-containing CTD phosphatase 1 [Sarcoptes scabiei]KPM03412.1 ubiquitin-like protein domain-containing CTD phosphatase 1-like protein [Sarcoptes scabiei]